MEKIKYRVKNYHCTRECPHGMLVSDKYMKKPRIAAVGSQLERACPFFVCDDKSNQVVTCDYIPATFQRFFTTIIRYTNKIYCL